MSWPQQPNWQNAAPPALNTSNAAVPSNMNPYMGFAGASTDQYAQYQNWQQWQTYHQQYAQWHAQYGELYQKEMQAQYGTTGSGAAPPPPVPTPMGISPLTAPLPVNLPVGFGVVPPPPPPNEPIPPPPDSAPPSGPDVGPNDSTIQNQAFIGPIHPSELTETKPSNDLNRNVDRNTDLNKGNTNFEFNPHNKPPNFIPSMNDNNQQFDWNRSGNNFKNANNQNNNRFDSNRGGGGDSFGYSNYQNNNNRGNLRNSLDNFDNSRDGWNQNQRNKNNWNDQDDSQDQRSFQDNQNNSGDSWNNNQNARDKWSNNDNQRGDNNWHNRGDNNNRNSQGQSRGDNWNNQNQRGENRNNSQASRDNWGGGDNQNARDNWNRDRDNFQNSRNNNNNNRNNRFSDFGGFGGNRGQSPTGQGLGENADSYDQNARDRPNRFSGFGGNDQISRDRPNRYSDSGLASNQGQMPTAIGQGSMNVDSFNQNERARDRPNRFSDCGPPKPVDNCSINKGDNPKAQDVKRDPTTGLELTTEEKAFDDQFQTWENEFVKWKRENANHPDKKAYREYEMKFEEFRRKLLDRREAMRKRRLEELNIIRESEMPPLVAATEPLVKQENEIVADSKPAEAVQVGTVNPSVPAKELDVSAPVEHQKQQVQPQQPAQSTPGKIPSLFDVKIDQNLVEDTVKQNSAAEDKNKPFLQNESGNLFKGSSGGGIPGLDLIPASTPAKEIEKLDEQEAEVINLDDENSPKKPEPEKKLPPPEVKKIDPILQPTELKREGPSTLSQGINNILGDPNLVSILNLVQPALSQINPMLRSSIDANAINQLNPLLSVIDALTKQQHLPHLLQAQQQPPSLFHQIIPHPDSMKNPFDLQQNMNIFDKSKEASGSRMSCDRSITNENEKNSDQLTKPGIVFESDDFAIRLRELKEGKLNLNNKQSDVRATNNNIVEYKDVKDPKECNVQKKEEDDDNSFEKRLRDLKAGRLGNLLDSREQSIDRKSNVSNEDRPHSNENNNRFGRRSRFSNANDDHKIDHPNDRTIQGPPPLVQGEMSQPKNDGMIIGAMVDKINELPRSVGDRFGADRFGADRFGTDRDHFNDNQRTFNRPAINDETNEMFKPTQVIDYQNKSLGLAKSENRWDGVDILMPTKVVDYGHKKPAMSLSNVDPYANDEFLPPMKTIDYGHTSSTAIGQRRRGNNDDYLNQYNKRSRYPENNYRETSDSSWSRDNRSSGNSMDSNSGYSTNKWVPKNFQQHQAPYQQYQQYAHPSANKGSPPVMRDQENLCDNSFDEQIKRAKLLKKRRITRDRPDDLSNQYSDNSNSAQLPDDLEAVSDEDDNAKDKNMLDDADDISAEEFDEQFDDNALDQDNDNESLKQPLPVLELPEMHITQALPQRTQPIVKPIVINTLQKPVALPTPPSPAKPIVLGANTISMDDILLSPGRKVRPQRILIIMRGPPGCGKTFLSKLIKDKEVEMGGSAPRIMSIDDYFMTEIDTVEKCPKTGRDIKSKKMEYEYEKEMEETYYSYLLRSFKKNITDGLFNFIIVDCANETEKSYSDFYNFGKSNSFTPYICQLEMDLQTCLSHNTHKRSELDIENMIKNWIPTPEHYLKVDSRALLQSVQISDVEMEDVVSDEEFMADDGNNKNKNDNVDDDEGTEFGMFKSKWETGPSTEENLARLDGTSKPLRQATIEDYLQTDDDVWEPPETTTTTTTKPGKKRVRWADIEEKRAQEKMRAIGFVVGQTDWKRMMDPTGGSGALTQTKYIERLKKKN